MDIDPGTLYQASYAALEATDRAIEFWLSASFAIVVATFLASERLNRAMYIFITGGYLLVSANMLGRYWIHAARYVQWRDILIELGEPYNTSLSVAVVGTQLAIFVVGTCGTLYFVWHTYLQKKRGTNEGAGNA